LIAVVVALVWPIVAGLTILPGQIGVFELRLAKRIGYPDTVSFSFPSRLIAFIFAIPLAFLLLSILFAIPAER